MTEPAPATPAATPAVPWTARLARYSKAITALIGVALTGAVAVYGTSNKWVVLAIGAASVLGVYGVPNKPGPPA